MGITANSGPFLGYGITQTSTGQTTEYNEERGPSLFDLGHATLDPRFYFNYDPGSPVGTRIFGIFGQRAEVDYVPTAISTDSLAVSSATTPVAGTAITLTPGSTVGTIQTTIVAPETGKAVSVIAIDSTAQYLAFGTGGTVALWNPAAGTGRTIQLSLSATAPDIGAFTVAGRDMYGFKMTETIPTGGSGSTAVSSYAGQKAFKYVTGVTPSSSTTINSTGIGIGFTDVYGMPLLCKYVGIDTVVAITATSSIPTSKSTGAITLGTTVASNLVSTGIDVRGTYVSTTASNGTIRLQIAQAITPAMVSSITASDTSAIFGGTQFSSV
jgi:hypothetical protein